MLNNLINQGFIMEGDKVSTLLHPREFRLKLLEYIENAQNRILINCLYLENDESGQEVMAALKKAVLKNPHLIVDVFLDLHRAMRSRMGEEKKKTNAQWYYEELKEFNRELVAKHGLTRAPITVCGVPCNARELFGVYHIKGYCFDDVLIYSGASINNNYCSFDTYRQDRYQIFEDKALADCYYEFTMRNFSQDPSYSSKASQEGTGGGSSSVSNNTISPSESTNAFLASAPQPQGFQNQNFANSGEASQGCSSSTSTASSTSSASSESDNQDLFATPASQQASHNPEQFRARLEKSALNDLEKGATGFSQAQQAQQAQQAGSSAKSSSSEDLEDDTYLDAHDSEPRVHHLRADRHAPHKAKSYSHHSRCEQGLSDGESLANSGIDLQASAKPVSQVCCTLKETVVNFAEELLEFPSKQDLKQKRLEFKAFRQNYLLSTKLQYEGVKPESEFAQVGSANARANQLTPGQILVTPVYGIGKNNPINLSVFDAIQSAKRTITIYTPYFNFTKTLTRRLMERCKNGIKVKIIVSDKVANDFYSLPESERYTAANSLPYLYEINLRQFVQAYQDLIDQGVLEIHAWRDASNSYHAKGIIIDQETYIFTGSNLNLRSFNVDTENALIVYDPYKTLAQKMSEELDYFQEHTTKINNYQEIDHKKSYPKRVRKTLRHASLFFIDKLAKRLF